MEPMDKDELIRELRRDLANKKEIIQRWHKDRIGEKKASRGISEIIYTEGRKCYMKVTLPLPPSLPKSLVWDYAPKTFVDEDKTVLFKAEVIFRGDRWYAVYRKHDFKNDDSTVNEIQG